MMKIGYITLVATFLLVGCDDSFDALNTTNSSPVISFSKDEIQLSIIDSVKVSPKLGNLEYSGEVFFSDKDNGINGITFVFTKKSGEVYLEGNLIDSNIIFKVDQIDNLNFKIVPTDGTGDYEIKVSVIDNLGAEGSATIELTAYENLAPVAMLSVEKVAIVDPLEYSFSASGSYDKDVNRGGGLMRYQYSVGDVDLPVTDQPVINFIFPKPGGYEVKLKVQDNDGEWSNQATLVVTAG